jgi:hypothetical protein
MQTISATTPSMKTALLFVFCVSISLSPLVQGTSVAGIIPDSSLALEVVERGPHHAIIQTVRQVRDETGAMSMVTNSYTELANGMNVLDANGQYQPAEAVFELFNNGVIARKTAHQVILAPSPVAEVPVDLLMPDGLRLTSRVIGINLYDSASGQSTLIGETRDCAGKLVGLDTVVFADAFDGVDADLVYHLSRGGLSQEIIVRENLSKHAPDVYQFDPASTRVEVVTEFFDPPKPEVTETILVTETDPQKRAAKHEPDFSDQMLTWPTMIIGPGKAFAEDESAAAPSLLPPPLLVGKRLQTIAGRTLLFEAVAFGDLQPLLDQLPDGQQANANPKREAKICKTRREMVARLHAAKATTKAIQVAQALPSRKGLVLDYNVLSSMTNLTFLADTTYFLDTGSSATLSGTTIIEGGTVIKFGKYAVNDTVEIVLLGPLVCNTTPYRPAIFTAKDDNTVGDIISGSTGSPSGYYPYRALLCYVNAANNFIHDVRFNYARMAVSLYGLSGHTVRHAQFGNCGWAIEVFNAGSAALQNLLFYNSFSACVSYFTPISGEHLTVNSSGNTSNPLFWNVTNSTFAVTNSLFVNVTNIGTITSINNATNSSATGVLQTVGAGAHYLVAGSAYRNAGMTNINAALANELKTRTTYPPIGLTNDFTVNTTLAPQAQRDTDIPDLGWHYGVLDYSVIRLNINSGVTLLLTNGVVIATAATNTGAFQQNVNFTLQTGAKFVSEGSPGNLNRIVHYHAVQEEANSSWAFTNSVAWVTLSLGSGVTGGLEEARLRFTDLPLPSGNYYSMVGASPANHLVSDCQFHGGVLLIQSSSDPLKAAYANCLFERVRVGVSAANTLINNYSFYNNSFFGGSLTLSMQSPEIYTFKDNLFDKSGITNNTLGTSAMDFNGYVTGQQRLSPNGAHDVILASSPSYQSSTLGNFYIPLGSALINAGSRSPAAAALYHHTVKTDQTKEGVEAIQIVDIGFHYVAVVNGVPSDADSDGLPDYLEDRNGNGIVDPGEADWMGAGLKVFITEPKSNSNIP